MPLHYRLRNFYCQIFWLLYTSVRVTEPALQGLSDLENARQRKPIKVVLWTFSLLMKNSRQKEGT